MGKGVLKKAVSLIVAIIFAVSTIQPTAFADTDALRATSLRNTPSSVGAKIRSSLSEVPTGKSYLSTAGKLEVESMVELVIGGYKAKEAAKVLFNAYKSVQLPSALEAISNELKEKFIDNRTIEPYVKEFYTTVIKLSLSLQNSKISKALQLMAGQALNIISWIKRDVPEGEAFGVTADMDRMATSPKGLSYLDVSALPFLVVDEEGGLGFYHRGTEGIDKLGVGSVSNPAFATLTRYDSKKFQTARNKQLIYLMAHCLIGVPDVLKKLTREKKLSTIHETSFLHDMMPGSIQATSTGVGHYQGISLDIKYVTEGEGIQFNILYDEAGNIIEVLAQRVSAGSWTFALPGYADFMVNLGGLRFNDISIKLDPKDMKKINPAYDPMLAGAVATIVKNAEFPPYTTISTGGKHYMLRTIEDAPKPIWISNPTEMLEQFTGKKDLLTFYQELNEKKIADLIRTVVENIGEIHFHVSDDSLPELITNNQAKTRIKQIKDLIEQAKYSPLITTPAEKNYAWGGIANQIVLGRPIDKNNPIAELWFNSTHNDGLSTIPDTALGDVAPITLKELLGYNPEMLGESLDKGYFEKFECTNFVDRVHMGFNEKLNEVGIEVFIEWLKEERELEHELKNLLDITDEETFRRFKEVYTNWCDYQAGSRWWGDFIPDIKEFVKSENRRRISQLMSKIQGVRARIVELFNEIELEPGKVILSPVGYPHSIFGLSHQTHPLKGPQAKNEAWIVIPVNDTGGNEHLILVEPQQTSNITFSFADFFTPIVFKKDKGLIMRKNLARRPTTSEEDFLQAEFETIEMFVRKGLKDTTTEEKNFVLEPQIERGKWRDRYGKDLIAKEEVLIQGTYPNVWPQEYFNVHRFTLNGKGKGAEAELSVAPVEGTSHDILVIKGEVVISSGGKDIPLKRGQSLYVPSTVGRYVLSAKGEAEVLKFFKPVEEVKSLIGAIATKSASAGSYVTHGVDVAETEKDLSRRIKRLERLHFILRLLPLAVDIFKETKDDSRILGILAEVTGGDIEADAAELRKLPQKVEAEEWRHLYRAVAKAYLEAGDIWRTIFAYNAVLKNGGYEIGRAELEKGEAAPEELLTMLTSLYAMLHPGLNLKTDQLSILTQALHNPETLRRHKSEFDLEQYKTLTKIVAYHQIMTRDAQYTAANRVSSKSRKEGVESFSQVFGLTVKDSAKLLNEISDILNEVPEKNGHMRPFAGVEIIDNPHEITYKEKRTEGKLQCVDNILFDDTREIKAKGVTIQEHIEVREGDIIRRFDIMEHGQWFSYRTYDLRSAFRTTDLKLPGITERYPALMSKKLIFSSAIELGTTMLEGMGLKDEELKRQIEKNPKLHQQLREKVWGLVSGGCRLPIQEHRDVYALGLLYSGVNVFLVKSNKKGLDRAMKWIKEDLDAGRLRPEDVERFNVLAEDFEKKGIISTPMYYLIVNLLWNDGICVGEGRGDLLEAYKEAEHLLFGGGHGTASHNPWEFSGWKQMLSWFDIKLDKKGREHTLAQVLSINDEEMQGLKEGIIAGRTRPCPEEQLKEREIKVLSAVEVAYTHYLYSIAYIRLGRDIWGWLWKRAIHQKGGIRELIMATRELDWDDKWEAIRKDLGKSLGFSRAEQKEFDEKFSERPLLCWQRPFEKYSLPTLGLGYQHGSGGMDQIIFRALGQKVLVVHDDPDYMFPDGEPYPNIPWFVRQAMATFEEKDVEIAIIGDEDKDRLITWLPQLAKMVQGDELMALYARTIARQDVEKARRLGEKDTQRTIFYVEVKFYAGFKLLVEKMKQEYLKQGIRLHMDVLEGPVGFGYVKDEMKQTEGSIMAENEETLIFGGRKSNLLVNLRNNARIGGGAEVSGHGMEPLSGAEMSAVEITNKMLVPMVMGDRTFGAFLDAYNELPKSFASPEVRIGTHANFGRYEKQKVVNRVLERFKKYIGKLGFEEAGTRRQYQEGKRKYGSLYYIYKPAQPVDIKLTGMTLHNVSEIALDLIDGAKYYVKCDEGQYFVSFLSRKSNTQNEIITRVDGDSIEVRNAIATWMYGFFEQVDATDLLTEEAKEKGEAAIILSRDLWIVYEVLPRLAYQLLPKRIQKQLDRLAEQLIEETLQALAEGKIIKGLRVKNRDNLGYFYSFKGERKEGFDRIVHWTEKMLGSDNPLLIPEEQDLGEMVDTFLGYRLPDELARAIREIYGRSLKAKTAKYNTALNYDYDDKGRLGLELLAARYVTRRVKDKLAVMDVARLRKEEDFPYIEIGQKLLLKARYLFEVTDVNGAGIQAKFIQTGQAKPDFIEDGDSVIIHRLPVEKASHLVAGDEVPFLTNEIFITFDPNAILNDRHSGFLITKDASGIQPLPLELTGLPIAEAKSSSAGKLPEERIAEIRKWDRKTISGDEAAANKARQMLIQEAGGKVQQAITELIQHRDDQYIETVGSTGTATIIGPSEGLFTPGHDAFEAVKKARKALIAADIVSYNQIEGHLKAAMAQNAAVIFAVGRSQLSYALHEKRVVAYVREVAERIGFKNPLVLHGGRLQYEDYLFDAKAILKEEYEKENGEGTYNDKIRIDTIDVKILEAVQRRLNDNLSAERAIIKSDIESLIEAGFTSIGIDASTIYDGVAGEAVLDYYEKNGTPAEDLVVSLERNSMLPLEWGADFLKANPYDKDNMARLDHIRGTVISNMKKRNRAPGKIDSVVRNMNAAFGVLRKKARMYKDVRGPGVSEKSPVESISEDEVIAAYDKIMREVARATIAGDLSPEVSKSISEKQKLLLLPTSNAEETAHQLEYIDRIVDKHTPELTGHFGKVIEVGQVDKKVPNPRRDGKLEPKMTHPAVIRVMGEYLKLKNLSFDLIATNNGSGHGIDYDMKTLAPIPQVDKISPWLTEELQKEAERFNVAIVQPETIEGDMEELAVLAKAGVIKFNIATNYQQIILNTLALLDDGLTPDEILERSQSDTEALVNGLHKNTREKIKHLAMGFKDDFMPAKVEAEDSLFVEQLKRAFAWGVEKAKIRAASTKEDIATVLAKEFKRVFYEMNNKLYLLGHSKTAKSSSAGEVIEVDDIKFYFDENAFIKRFAADVAFNEALNRLEADIFKSGLEELKPKIEKGKYAPIIGVFSSRAGLFVLAKDRTGLIQCVDIYNLKRPLRLLTDISPLEKTHMGRAQIFKALSLVSGMAEYDAWNSYLWQKHVKEIAIGAQKDFTLTYIDTANSIPFRYDGWWQYLDTHAKLAQKGMWATGVAAALKKRQRNRLNEEFKTLQSCLSDNKKDGARAVDVAKLTLASLKAKHIIPSSLVFIPNVAIPISKEKVVNAYAFWVKLAETYYPVIELLIQYTLPSQPNIKGGYTPGEILESLNGGALVNILDYDKETILDKLGIEPGTEAGRIWSGLLDKAGATAASAKSSSAGVRIGDFAELKPIENLYSTDMPPDVADALHMLRNQIIVDGGRLDHYLWGEYMICSKKVSGKIKSPISLIGPFFYTHGILVALMAIEYKDGTHSLLAISGGEKPVFYDVSVKSKTDFEAVISQPIDSEILRLEATRAWKSYLEAQAKHIPDIRIKTEQAPPLVYEASKLYLEMMRMTQQGLYQQLIGLARDIGTRPTAGKKSFQQCIRTNYKYLDETTFKPKGLIAGISPRDFLFTVRSQYTNQTFLISCWSAISTPSQTGKKPQALEISEINRICVAKTATKSSSAGTFDALNKEILAAQDILLKANLKELNEGHISQTQKRLNEIRAKIQVELRTKLTDPKIETLFAMIRAQEKTLKYIMIADAAARVGSDGQIVFDPSIIPDVKQRNAVVKQFKAVQTALEGSMSSKDKASTQVCLLEDILSDKVKLGENAILISNKQKLQGAKLLKIDGGINEKNSLFIGPYLVALARGLLSINENNYAQLIYNIERLHLKITQQPLAKALKQALRDGSFNVFPLIVDMLPGVEAVDKDYIERLQRQAWAALIAA